MREFKGVVWQVVDDYDKHQEGEPQIYIWDGDEQAHSPICDMGEIGDMNYADTLANARLIAAAPELLEALQLLLYGWDNADFEHDVSGSFDKAREAVNKALGKETPHA